MQTKYVLIEFVRKGDKFPSVITFFFTSLHCALTEYTVFINNHTFIPKANIWNTYTQTNTNSLRYTEKKHCRNLFSLHRQEPEQHQQNNR